MATLYRFYVHDKNLSKEEYRRLVESGAKIDDINPLYAITVDKKIAQKFMEQRDMNKFVLIKTKDMDEESIESYVGVHQSLLLHDYKYYYYPNKKNNDPYEDFVYIISTYLEKTHVSDMCDSQLLDFPVKIDFTSNPDVLKKKYRDALDILNYTILFKMSSPLANVYMFDMDDDWSSVPDIMVDQLEVFINEYGKYMKA